MATGPNLFDPKYAPGAEQARQDVMVGVSVVMTFIGGQSMWLFVQRSRRLQCIVACVALRVYTRGFIVGRMGAEDWTMIVAAVSLCQFGHYFS
jgi:hypothetical protein